MNSRPKMQRVGWRLLATAMLLGVIPGLARAHTVSLTYAEVAIDPSSVRWYMSLPIPEMNLWLGLDKNNDGKVDAQELEAGRTVIRDYVFSKVGVIQGGRSLDGTMGLFSIWTDSDGHSFAKTTLTFLLVPNSAQPIRLHCDLLRDVVSMHRTLARINIDGKSRQFVFENGKDFEAENQSSAFTEALQFVRMGILHIFTGYDHIAFLLGVVLIGGSFRTIVKVITSFTVAHSITLALAALNIVVLPTRLVESGIALSIMYIAAENLFFKQFDRRWIVTFFFGLIHGFGFASALREVNLSGSLLGIALFSFNVGVEIGQICIVSALMPLLWFVARKNFQGAVIRYASICIFVLGGFWFWRRLMGID